MSRWRRIALVGGLVVLVSGSLPAATLNERWRVDFSERFRLVTWDNAVTLRSGNSRTFTRHRTQLGAVWSPTGVVSLSLQFANEFRYYTVPSDIDFDLDEVFVDQLYLKFKRPWSWPLMVTLGRQNIMLGEGFVVMDGHPLDGSRSIYFNAVRVDLQHSEDLSVTGFVSYQEETDGWLPVVHERDRALVEQPELGAGMYLRGLFEQREGHLYVVHKERRRNEANATGAITTTIGGRLKQLFGGADRFTAVIETGYQFGDYGEVDRRAYGGYAYVEYRPDRCDACVVAPALLRGGIIYLSGDDPSTETREDWEPMFARWPKWSESYIYTLVPENGVAWWTNLVSINAGIQFRLTPRVDLRLDYHHLMAAEGAGRLLAFPGGDGTTRGDLVMGKLSFTVAKRWTGHLLWEHFSPGDFYFESARQYSWLRTELMFRY